MLEVSTQILSPIGDDEKVLPDFSYLQDREKFEANINSSLDISLRNQHGVSIRNEIQFNPIKSNFDPNSSSDMDMITVRRV